MTTSEFTAVILAADRNPHDPLVQASNACCKALVEVDGIPMLQRVVCALQDSEHVEHILLSGPARAQLESNKSIAMAQGNKSQYREVNRTIYIIVQLLE